jgi:hypothetical protein
VLEVRKPNIEVLANLESAEGLVSIQKMVSGALSERTKKDSLFLKALLLRY